MTPDPEAGSAPGWPLVLYFHHVHPVIDHYTNVRPDQFARGLDLVLSAFDAADPVALLTPGRLVPPDRPTVLLTFDDGYRDLLTNAVGALNERGVKAVFFVNTGLVGQHDDDPRTDFLDWEHCRELAADGHLVASHGVDHTPVDTMTGAEAERQVVDSLAELRRRVGTPQAVYAYPYGIQAHLPAHIDGFGPLLAFGSVKAAPRPWDGAPLSIRRTYLPSDDENAWPALVGAWLNAWHRSDRE